MTTTVSPALPTTVTAASAVARTFRHRRRPATAAISAAIAALLFSAAAWLSLVFSPSPLHNHIHLTPLPSPSLDYPFSNFNSSTAANLSSSSLKNFNKSSELSLEHIVFGIAGSAQLWTRRKEFIRLWWRPESMRGHVWLDRGPRGSHKRPDQLPLIRVSEDISRFRYTNPTGHPSGLRIARIIAETFKLGRHRSVRWFLLCDDDTVISPDNLVDVLSKYDWREMVYVGAPSESHSANTYFSHSMAFGGGGIAISYPLAEALAGMQDECLERYPKLYGSDDRLHACITELGVPLTKEYGFHQWDIRGNPRGLLAAHPIAPFVSIHHVEAVEPIFPGLSSLESLKLFTRAMTVDSRSFLQRAICYNRNQKLTFSISLGYVVQVYPQIVLPRDLERSEQTYTAWNRNRNRDEFDFDTRDAHRSICKKPLLFFLKNMEKDGNVTTGRYKRAKGRDDLKRKVLCFPRSIPLRDVSEIHVLSNPLKEKWHLVPRRLCCKLDHTIHGILQLNVGQCAKGSAGPLIDSV